MLRYRILAVGRRAQDPLVKAAQGYEKRLGAYTKITCEILREQPCVQAEGRMLLARIAPQDTCVAFDQRGQTLSTRALCACLTKLRDGGQRQLTLVIGGAAGLCPQVKARCQQTWSLSALTLPHRLALVLVLEQLYRAHTIWRGEPYHRD